MRSRERQHWSASMAPPDPLDDLHDRPLPIDEIARGRVLYRSHRVELDAIYYSYGNRSNRFDSPTGEYGVCYLATAIEGAFAETFLRDVKSRFLSADDLRGRAVAEIDIPRGLRLARLHSDGLGLMGTTAATSAGSMDSAQRWSQAIFRHPDGVDGIAYAVRHDNACIGVALFHRPDIELTVLRSTPWLRHPSMGSLLRRYRIGIAF